MKESGKMTYRMAMERKHGKMGISMKGVTDWARKMGRDCTNGMMEANMKGITQ